MAGSDMPHGVDDLVRRSLAGWRSHDAPEIYAGVDKRERDEAGQAMVQLVTGARD